jgi:hypothetical protein
MKDPSNPSKYVLKSNAKKLFAKEMKYVQQGWLSDVPGVVKYVLISGPGDLPRWRAISGTTSALEGYHLIARLALITTGNGGSHLRLIRLTLFNWQWNVTRMSEAKMIPQCGHMFLNILDEICFVLTRIFRDVPLPHGFNEYTPVDTARAPLVLSGRTGFDPHLVAEAYKRNSLDTAAMDSLRATVISPLKLEFEISKVLVHWRLAIAGDCDAIRQLTGIKTTPKFLAEMVKRQIDKLRTSQALKANIYRSQTQGLRGTSALASGDGLGEGNEAIESAASQCKVDDMIRLLSPSRGSLHISSSDARSVTSLMDTDSRQLVAIVKLGGISQQSGFIQTRMMPDIQTTSAHGEASTPVIGAGGNDLSQGEGVDNQEEASLVTTVSKKKNWAAMKRKQRERSSNERQASYNAASPERRAEMDKEASDNKIEINRKRRMKTGANILMSFQCSATSDPERMVGSDINEGLEEDG